MQQHFHFSGHTYVIYIVKANGVQIEQFHTWMYGDSDDSRRVICPRSLLLGFVKTCVIQKRTLVNH